MQRRKAGCLPKAIDAIPIDRHSPRARFILDGNGFVPDAYGELFRKADEDASDVRLSGIAAFRGLEHNGPGLLAESRYLERQLRISDDNVRQLKRAGNAAGFDRHKANPRSGLN
jgi:hypothetical protein